MTAQELKKKRKERKLSQQQLADAIGAGRGKVAICELEKGTKPITPKWERLLIDYFNPPKA